MKTKNIKIKIQETINTKGILNLNSMDLEKPEERYIISLSRILSTINSRKVNLFLLEYQKLIFRKNIPLFTFDTATLLYERWLNCSDVCDLLTYFSKKIGSLQLSEEVWEMVIYKSYYSKGEREMLLDRYFLLAQLFQQKIFTKKLSVQLIPSIKNVLSIKIINEGKLISRRKMELNILKTYKVLFIWSGLLVKLFGSNAKKLNDLIERMLRRHFKVPSKYNNKEEQFVKFVMKINQFVNYKYILNSSFKDLHNVFEIFKVNPQIFEEEWIELEKFSTNSILKMIFSRFKVSNLFIRNYFTLTLKEKEWLFHILKRNSLKSAKELPLPLTKKAAHVFLNIEWDIELSVKDGLVYSSLLSLGTDNEYAMEVLSNIRNLTQSEFWVKTMSQFYHKGLAIENIGDTMDYINQCHYLDNRKINWKQKSANNLIKDTAEWHLQIIRQQEIKRQKYNRFSNSEISGFTQEINEKNYIIRQIKTSDELSAEGNKLNHCVYSYRSSCRSGFCEIFSLRLVDDLLETPLVTIEIRNNKIYQAKGKFNRKPIDVEWDVIREWANFEDLRIAC